MPGQRGVFAGETLYPMTIVYLSGEYTVSKSGASPTNPLFGVTQENCKYPPNSPWDNPQGFAAAAGDPIRVYQIGQECKVRLGASVTAGDWLTSDTNGYATPISFGAAAGTELFYIAQAFESGSAGDFLWIRIQPGVFTAG